MLPVKRRGRPRKRSQSTQRRQISTSMSSALLDGTVQPATIPALATTLYQHLEQAGSLIFPLVQHVCTGFIAILLTVLRETVPIMHFVIYKVLSKPLAVLLLGFGLSLAMSCILPTLFCRVPGVSILNPYCHATPTVNITPNMADEGPSNTMLIAESNDLFGNVISQASPLKQLPYVMTQTEMAIRDVRTTVAVSSLSTYTQEQMLQELSSYVDFSGDTINRLQTFTANLLGTVDRVLLNTEWTILELRHLEANSTRSIMTYVRSALGLRSKDTLFVKVSAQLEKHIDNIEPSLTCRIVEAQSLLANFESLRQPLDNLKLMVAVSSKHTSEERTQLQVQQWSWTRLWALVGGEAEAMGAFGRQLDMLQKVDDVVDAGLHSLGNTLIGLRSINSQIKTLRDSLKRSQMENRELERLDLAAIVVGAERLSKLHSGERGELAEISQKLWIN